MIFSQKIQVILCFAILATTPSLWAQNAELFYTPSTTTSQLLVSHELMGEKKYIGFPTSIQLDQERMLIAFKRGTSHGGDQEADADAIIFNPRTNQVMEHFNLGNLPRKIFQLTVPMKTHDGRIKLYTDLQNRGQDGKNYRDGIRFSEFNPKTNKTSNWEKLPIIDGIEYGYPFDFIVEGKTVYMLAMSFGYRPGETWSVAVLRSDDGTATWKFVKDITQALGGGPINESSFVRKGDDFYIVCRGYSGQTTRIAHFDQNFNLINVADLTGQAAPLNNYIGWPRIFLKGDHLYVLGRIWPKLPQQTVTNAVKDCRLGLVRINAKSLEIEKITLLDNAQGHLPIVDGYYAAFYWQDIEGRSWFNAITYRSFGSAKAPDIIRLSFLWDEVK